MENSRKKVLRVTVEIFSIVIVFRKKYYTLVNERKWLAYQWLTVISYLCV